MGSDSGGGGGDSGGYDAAPLNYSRQKKQRKREEQRVLQAEQDDQKGYFARGSGGSIARSSTGGAITSRAGAKVVDDFRSQEVSELYGSDARMRDAARMQLENRLLNPQLPRIGAFGVSTGIIADMNLKRQMSALEAGGRPQFRRTRTGRYVATSVTSSGDDSSPNIDSRMDDSGSGAGGAARRAIVSSAEAGNPLDVAAGMARKLLGQRASGAKRRKIY
jgi:hypothetical protein